MNRKPVSIFKKWLRFSRLLPILTIGGACTAIVLSQIGILKLTISENIVIALLALMAVDALSERISVLERIESSILKLTEGNLLRKRTELIRPEHMAQYASEICILAVHALFAMSSQGFFQQKLREGCRVRVIILNPESKILKVSSEVTRESRSEQHIKLSMMNLKLISEDIENSKLFEVRLSEVFYPFSMFAVDLEKDSGTMNVNMHPSPYRKNLDDAPHIRLNAMTDKYWFNYYREHFELAWSKSLPWKTKKSP